MSLSAGSASVRFARRCPAAQATAKGAGEHRLSAAGRHRQLRRHHHVHAAVGQLLPGRTDECELHRLGLLQQLRLVRLPRRHRRTARRPCCGPVRVCWLWPSYWAPWAFGWYAAASADSAEGTIGQRAAVSVAARVQPVRAGGSAPPPASGGRRRWPPARRAGGRRRRRRAPAGRRRRAGRRRSARRGWPASVSSLRSRLCRIWPARSMIGVGHAGQLAPPGCRSSGSPGPATMRRRNTTSPFHSRTATDAVVHPRLAARQVGELVVVRGEQHQRPLVGAACRCSATAQAIEMPSKVLVPRPISSSTARLRGVSWVRMLAVSFISTMKVDSPPARLSEAPTRVKRRSTTPISAAGRRHEAAHLRQQRDQRDLAQVGRLAGHVGPGDDQDLLRRRDRAGSRWRRSPRARPSPRPPGGGRPR